MSGAAAPLLVAEKVTRVLPGTVPVTLVADISLTIAGGELAAITGPSGSGKSSLLYLLGLLDQPTSGRVLLEGRDTSDMGEEDLADLRLRKLGFVFQFHFLLPEFTVLENVVVPMRKAAALGRKEMQARAMALLDDLGVADSHAKLPEQLSGGQRQRVAIARALANDPPLILADEPTGNLDTKNGSLVFDIFQRLVGEQGRSVIAVTHDLDLADRCPRRLHLVDGRLVGDSANGGV